MIFTTAHSRSKAHWAFAVFFLDKKERKNQESPMARCARPLRRSGLYSFVIILNSIHDC